MDGSPTTLQHTTQGSPAVKIFSRMTVVICGDTISTPSPFPFIRSNGIVETYTRNYLGDEIQKSRSLGLGKYRVLRLKILRECMKNLTSGARSIENFSSFLRVVPELL